MEKPIVYALGRMEWQMFLTLTFARIVPQVQRRLYWFAFVRAVARVYNLHFNRLVWLLRSEHGEMTGRFHYHALFRGIPVSLFDNKTAQSSGNCGKT